MQRSTEWSVLPLADVQCSARRCCLRHPRLGTPVVGGATRRHAVLDALPGLGLRTVGLRELYVPNTIVQDCGFGTSNSLVLGTFGLYTIDQD